MMSGRLRQYLECGKVVNTHGIAGGIKAESWCDQPEILSSLNQVYFLKSGVYIPIKVMRSAVQKRFVLLWLEGINDIDKAEALRGTVLFADRNDMPLEEGDYFIADLVGLSVIDVDSGRVYGTVSEVFNSGASDIYTVKTPEGERMIPAVGEFIKRIEIEKGIFIRAIEGMFD